jgi:malonate transporter
VNAIITITLPIFLLIGLGYALVRGGLFSPEQFQALGRVTVTVAMPAMVLRALGGSALGDVLNVRYLAAYGGASVALFIAGLAIGLMVRRRSLTVAAIRSLAMSGSNTAFIGFPVAYQVIGPFAGICLALSVLIENLLMIPAMLALAEAGQGSGSSIPRVLGRTFLNLLRTPLLIAVVLGMILAATGLGLPTPLAKAVDMLANVAPASALMVIGASLVGLDLKGVRATVGIIAFGKLVVHPLVVLGAVTLLGVQSPELRIGAVLFAASPMMSILAILAQKYGEGGPTAAALLVTTATSFFTLSGWLWLITHGLVR